jgi:hypothetical protein
MYHLFKLLDASDNKPVSTDACVEIPEFSNTGSVLTKTADNLVKDNVFTESKICSYAFRHGYTLHAWRDYAQKYREQLASTVEKAKLQLSIARQNIAVDIAKNAALIKQAEEETVIKRKQAEEETAIKRKQAEEETTIKRKQAEEETAEETAIKRKQAEALIKQAEEETTIKRKQAEEETTIKRKQAEEETAIKRKQAEALIKQGEEETAIKRTQAESSLFHVLKSWFEKSTK